jgi:hyperosmotically inducible periplasmic protein
MQSFYCAKGEGRNMKTLKLAGSCFVMGLLLLPTAGCSVDKSTHRSSANKDTSPSSTGEYVKDSVITTKIKAKMAADKYVSALDVKVETDKEGVVVLSGTAKNQSEIDHAVSISRSVDGVTKVINRIRQD